MRFCSVVFVHGLQHGSVSDWRDEDRACWPAEHLSLDLGTARIFSFGYDFTKANVRSDGHYGGGVLLRQGEDLWSLLKKRRRSDQVCVRERIAQEPQQTDVFPGPGSNHFRCTRRRMYNRPKCKFRSTCAIGMKAANMTQGSLHLPIERRPI
jgi:hypothetical protein